ncbi:MAG: hypothetical protein ACK5GN_06075 [Pseudomonadota bacterium]|jgi:hypothetical protein
MKLIRLLQKTSVLAFILVGSLFGAGCATSPAPVAPNVSQDDPDNFEKCAFDLLSDFFCEEKRWPTEWAQLVGFEKRRGRDATWLEVVKEPQISSPRAIFLSLRYVSSGGVPRRATYIAPPRCGREAEEGVVSIAADGVVFDLPAGFKVMSASDVRERWKAPPYPDVAWNTSDGRVLAVRFGDVDIKSDELPQFAADIAEAYESSIPSLVWTFKDSKVINDKPVLYHEFQSTASSGPILNVVFSGSFADRLFAITITGPTEISDAVVQSARQVEQSLRVR